ncbi:NAD(P)-dependent oxidoreductase [Streptomyces sp. ISL-94]|uniref:NAD-dependent epimerase/dehydratase family protein n=1 Tax=Streptomyces sp. ISL-94 TaxID=2819190 RepID=UPI001BE8E33F|nr:NAD-dependent epimerase/dehydratase family protein [Streptomyces sp. ISL-94]MBT2478366.1 NAD-dependent epimerase/dehydratase family protein [Streptomyces sp. ISL-94]
MNRNEHGSTALVTGAGGFVGSHLVDGLLAQGWRVRGVDRRSPARDAVAGRNLARAMQSTEFVFEHMDLTDPRLRDMVSGVDAVFHLAASTGVRGSWGKAFMSYVHDNVAATHRVIEECELARVPRLVVASSSSVYGGSAGGPSREDGPVVPLSPYGVSKLAGEQLALAYAARPDAVTRTVALRFFTVYGPRQREDMAISRMLDAVRSGQPMRLYGDGSQRRNFTYVADVVDALMRAAQTETTGCAVNVAGPVTVSMRDLLDTVREVTGSPVPVKRVPARSGDPESTEADPALAESVLGYRPGIGLAEGIDRQWAWTRATVDAVISGRTA